MAHPTMTSGRYDTLESELGVGFVHGDAYPGNTLWDDQSPLLGDWDEVASRPRELELINTHQGARVGRSTTDRQAFTDADGWDVTHWPGFPTGRCREPPATSLAGTACGSALGAGARPATPRRCSCWARC